MKYLIKIRIGILALALYLGSCNVTDLEPTHTLSASNAFQTIDDLEIGLNGLYSYMRRGAFYGNVAGQLPDMMSDNVNEFNQSLGNWTAFVDWIYVANNTTIAGYWRTMYGLINDANILLEIAPRFEGENPGQLNRVRGQALALRAWALFYLQINFSEIAAPGSVALDRNSTLKGVPVRTQSGIDIFPPRMTVAEVYDQIYADLEEALALLNPSEIDQAINPDTRTRIDFPVVNAMLARVSLYSGQYQMAIDYANAVINGSEGFSFALESGEGFKSIWTNDEEGSEVIWSISYLPGEGRPAGNVFFSVNNLVAFVPNVDLIAEYAADDIRLDSYVSTNVPLDGREGQLLVSKYLGRAGATDGVVNFKAFRLGEMYLILAEASSLLGNDSQGEAAINTLRAARIPSYEPETLVSNTLVNAIDLERRKELFMEGHRWYDLKRTTRTIERGAGCVAPAGSCSLAPSSHRWVWPIPQIELSSNPNLNDQNPEY